MSTTDFAYMPDEWPQQSGESLSQGFAASWPDAGTPLGQTEVPILPSGWSLPAVHGGALRAGHPVDPVFDGVLVNLQRLYRGLPDERKQVLAERLGAAKDAALKQYVAQLGSTTASAEMSAVVQHTSAAALRAALLFLAGELGRVSGSGEDTALALDRMQHEQELRDRAGGFLGPTEVHRLLGISRQTVLDWTKGFELMSVEDNGRRRYPLCQFGERHQVLAGLPAVLKTLAGEGITGWMALDVLLDAAPRYGSSPLALLRDGRAADALAAAQAYATQGAA